MTTIELNAELYRAMSEIADDRDSLEKALAFVKTLVPPKKKRRKSSNERLDDALAIFSGDWGGNI